MTKKEKKFAEDLQRCAGKYVGTYNDEVVACGDSIEEVQRQAAERNIDRPTIFPLPDFSEGHNFF